MIQRRDNYAIQAADARRLFLQRDQSAMLQNIPLSADEAFLTLPFFGVPYRIDRASGHIFRFNGVEWISADSHGETLTLFDYLCDAKPGRKAAESYTPVTNLSRILHSTLAEQSAPTALEQAIDRSPDAFRRFCLSLGGESHPGGDLCFRLNVFSDLPMLVQFWHSDEEFPPKLDFFWDKNTLDFLRYETIWFAAGVLRRRLAEGMEALP